MTYKSAQATVLEVSKTDQVTVVLIEIDKLVHQPVAPCGLYRDKPWEQVIALHRLVWTDGQRFRFETYNHFGSLPLAQQKYIFQSWWTPDQLEVAQSSPSRWQKIRFQPSDAFVSHDPKGDTVRRRAKRDQTPSTKETYQSDGWDHEHCKLCWKHISLYPCDEVEAYSDGKEWVCCGCFQEYIASGFGRMLGDYR